MTDEQVARLRLAVESEGVDKAQRELANLSKEGKKAEKSLDEVSKRGKGLTASMVALVGGVGGVTLAVKKTVQEWMRFDTAMVEVSTIAGVTTERMRELRKEALNISKTLGVDATDAAKGFYQAISAGVDQADVGQFITTSAKFAQAGMTDVATATDLLTTALNSYKIDAAEANQVGDKLFTTIKLGKTTAEELARSFARAGSAAANGGVQLSELLGIIAGITKTGVPTAEAFTQIKAAIAALYNPSSELAEIYNKLGVSGARQLIRQKGLAGALNAVREATSGNEAQFIKALRSIEAYSAALAITGTSLADTKELTDQVTDGLGAMDQAAGQVGDLLAIKMEKLKANFIIVAENVEQTTGVLAGAGIVIDSLSDSIEHQEGALGSLIGAFIEFSKEQINAGFDEQYSKIALSMEDGARYYKNIGRITLETQTTQQNLTKITESYASLLKEIGETNVFTNQKTLDLLNQRKAKLEELLSKYSEEEQAGVRRDVQLSQLLDKLRNLEITQDEHTEAVKATNAEYEKSISIIKAQESAQKAALAAAQSAADSISATNELRRKYQEYILKSQDEVLSKLEEEKKLVEDMLNLDGADVGLLESQLHLLNLKIDARKKYNTEAAKSPEQRSYERIVNELKTERERLDEAKKSRDALIKSQAGTPEEAAEQLKRSESRYKEDLERLSAPSATATGAAGIDEQEQINRDAERLDLEYSTKLERLQQYLDEEREIVLNATNLTQTEKEELIAKIEKQAGLERKAIYQAELAERLDATRTFLGGMAALAQTFGKKGFKAYQALAIAEATISTYAGAAKAIGAYPPPFNFIAAAGVIAQGLAQVARIKSQQPPAYQQGGIVGGTLYGGDQQLARVNSGEMILNKTQQARLFEMANNPLGGGDKRSGGNVTIVNNAPVQLQGEVEQDKNGDLQIVIEQAVQQTKFELTNEAQEGGGIFFPAFEQSYGIARK